MTINATEISSQSSINNMGMFETFSYYGLHEQSESVRWKFEDIDWSAIQKDKISAKELNQVRSIVNVEFTTFPGAINFFNEFSDDMDFTQWITTWLYEETKHPHVLMQYLSNFGEQFVPNDMLERRGVYPQGKDRIGTLAMNIISEMRAASWYLAIAKSVDEPVLQQICRLLSADESRHATGFYTYAKKLISQSVEPALEKLRAVEMLNAWLNHSVENRHPAGYFFSHTNNQDGLTDTTLAYSEPDLVDSRICRMFSTLTDKSILSRQDIRPIMRELSREAGLS